MLAPIHLGSVPVRADTGLEFTRVASLDLKPGEVALRDAAAIDPQNGFAYFGTGTNLLVKVRLSDFSRVGAIYLDPLGMRPHSSVLDTQSGFLYVGSGEAIDPGRIVKVRLSDFTVVASLKLNAGERDLGSALIDHVNGFAYFGTGTAPARIVKIRLSDFTRVGSVTLAPGENFAYSAVMDSAAFGYFGMLTFPGKVLKVRLSDLTRVAALTMASGEDALHGAAIDSSSTFAYFVTETFFRPANVIKVRLSDFTRVASTTMASGEERARHSTLIDSTNGFLYFSTDTFPGIVVKVRLSDFTRVASLTLPSDEHTLTSAVIDSDRGFAYFGTRFGDFHAAGRIVKIRLSDFVRVGSLLLGNGEGPVYVFSIFQSARAAAVIDTNNGFAYFGGGRYIVKLRLSDFTRVDSILIRPEENIIGSAVIDSPSGFAYFGTASVPGRIIRVRLSDFTHAGTLTLQPFDPVTNTGEFDLGSAVIDPDNGLAYFGTLVRPAVVVKVRLSDFVRLGHLKLDGVVPQTAVIDTAGGFSYFAGLGSIAKIRLSDFTQVGSLTFSPDYRFTASVIDTTNGFAYFGMGRDLSRLPNGPGQIVKVRLSDFSIVGSIPLNADEREVQSAVIDPTAGFAYFGTQIFTGTMAGRIVKVRLADFTRVASLTLDSRQGPLSSAVIDVPSQFAYFGTIRDLGQSEFRGVVHKIALGPNTPPEISSFTAKVSPEGSAVVFSVAATDQQNDPLTYSFDFQSDGIFDVTGPSSTAAFVWGDDHTGTAVVSVSDGRVNSVATTPVFVTNAQPVVTVTIGQAVEGNPLEVSYRITDPGSDDLSLTANWGDGTLSSRVYQLSATADPDESTDINPRDVSDTISHVFGDNANVAGTLTVSDDDGGSVSAALNLVVLNGEPQIAMAVVNDGDEGVPIAFSATATDPGSDDLTFTWHWDDGSVESRTYFNSGSGTDPPGSTGGTFPFVVTDTGTHLWGDDATYDVKLTVKDDDGGFVSITIAVAIANVPPSVTLSSDAFAYLEGSPITARADFQDPGTDDVNLFWFWEFGPEKRAEFLNNGVSADPRKSPIGSFPVAGTDSMVHSYRDDGVQTVTVEACDDDGGCSIVTLSLIINNAAPSAAITAPAPGSIFPVGTPVSFTGTFSDPGTADTHTASWHFQSLTTGISIAGTVSESMGSGSVEGTFTFAVPNVYMVTLRVQDDDGGVGTTSTVGDLPAMVVVYDPDGGYVTGGGWIFSEQGAYTPDPSAQGKAIFGFSAKYQKGATIPSGETQFRFIAGELNFHSTDYQWLIVSGARAQFKGSGTINGAGDYGFLLTAVDGQAGGGGEDLFRIKIWDKSTDQVIYDNEMFLGDFADPTFVIGAGSIVIHKG